MANVSTDTRGPNATYIPPAHVGLALGLIGFAFGLSGIRVWSIRLFGYQHVGIDHRVGGLDQRETPTQWNIGLSITSHLTLYHSILSPRENPHNCQSSGMSLRNSIVGEARIIKPKAIARTVSIPYVTQHHQMRA